MKKRLIIISLLFAGAASYATAQNTERFYSERFKDNIFVSVGAGAQANLNPDNFDYGIGSAITPNITLSLGKHFTPVWGARLQAAGIWSTLYTNHGLAADVYNEVEKKYVTLHADALFNLSNSICGYKPERLFTLSAFAGPGFTFAKAYGNQDDVNALINGSVGLMGNFNLNKYIDIYVEARGDVSPSIFGKYSSAHTDGALSLTAGLTYTLGGKKFISCSGVNEEAINAEVNKYRAQVADLEKQLEEAKAAKKTVTREVVKEVAKEVEVAGPRAIFFQMGKTDIDDYGMVNVRMAANIIKANPSKTYKVAGYADKATGGVPTNQKLSEKRAQAVYDALIAEGVSSSQLELVGLGGSILFDKDKLNRVVILE